MKKPTAIFDTLTRLKKKQLDSERKEVSVQNINYFLLDKCIQDGRK
jgi:hypothetical protein